MFMSATAEKSWAVNQPQITQERLAAAYIKARSLLLAEQSPEGFWTGELASSSLSSATAVCALSLVDRKRFARLVTAGIGWLLNHQNSDGGWGNTVKSYSNISTTMLCRAALTLARADSDRSERIADSLQRAELYLKGIAGGSEPQALASAVRARYGKD